MYKQITDFIKDLYPTKDFVALHEPVFIGNEKKYTSDCIDSTFVSSVGVYVTKFEEIVAQYTGAKYAVATVNGTSALHAALVVCGVTRDDEVLTQALTFVATANAISYTGAKPIFIDSDKKTLGMSTAKLEDFLKNETYQHNDCCYNKITKKRIAACVPMHVFGHPVQIERIKNICDKYNIILIEDAAESLGSYYKNKHTGTFGKLGVLSFNGNKVITTGGGGMIITDDEMLAQKAKHLTTTARIAHKWEFSHDQTGFNYRMPNINAALGCAQIENIDKFVANKRELAILYKKFFDHIGIELITEPADTQSNYWLNAIMMKDREERDNFLDYTNNNGVMTRPVWVLMNKLEMYKDCQAANLDNASWLEDRIVNIPSGVRL